jgi:D-serine deaminase-like pyridoxal phosphate-dependent protein
MPSIADLPTPALLVDVDVLERNLAWMAGRCDALNVALRPHLKTHKCVEIARRQIAHGARGVTVATLQEARDFADHGFDDVTWAFPVILDRLTEVQDLAARMTLRVVADSSEAVDALERLDIPLHVWLKVDCGYHRAGVDPDGPHALELPERISASGRLVFDGLLTHGGHAYEGPGRAQALAAVRQERDVLVDLAARLRARGLPVPGVSVGSTPGMRAVDHLDGVTEARPGNYAFFDYQQVALETCDARDCALTVLASVVSHRQGHDRAVVDAGALALSKDGAPDHAPHRTMGEVFEDYADGRLDPDRRLVSLSQEHGILRGALPVGTRVRILPNHSCLTAACFDAYHVVSGDQVVDRWPILRRR